MKFTNVQTNQIEDLDNVSSKAALNDPKYMPMENKFTVKVDGEFFHTDDIAKARQFVNDAQGEFVTPFELKKQEWEEKPILGSLASAGLGFLSGTTFGVSDVATRALGLEDESRAITEAAPISNVVGQVGSLLTPFGAEALVAKGLSTVAKGAVAATKLAKAAPLAEAAVRGAVSGARYGVTESSIQDAPLTVGDVAANMARNTLLGAALDSGFTAALMGGSKAVREAWRFVPGSTGARESVNNAFATAASKVPFGSNDLEALKSFVNKEQRQAISTFAADIDNRAASLYDTIVKSKALTKEIADTQFKNATEAYKLGAANTPNWVDSAKLYVDNVNSKIEQIIGDEALSGKVRSEAKRIRAMLDDTMEGSGRSTDSIADGLFDARSAIKAVRRSIDKPQLDGGVIQKMDKVAIDEVKNSLDDVFYKTINMPTAPGANISIVDGLKFADKTYAAQKSTEKILRAVVNRETGKVSPDKVLKFLRSGKLTNDFDIVMSTLQENESAIEDAARRQGLNVEHLVNAFNEVQDISKISNKFKDIRKATGMDTGRSLLGPIGTIAGVGGGALLGGPIGAVIGLAGPALSTLISPVAYLKAVDSVEHVLTMSTRMSKDASYKQLNKIASKIGNDPSASTFVQSAKDSLDTLEARPINSTLSSLDKSNERAKIISDLNRYTRDSVLSSENAGAKTLRTLSEQLSKNTRLATDDVALGVAAAMNRQDVYREHLAALNDADVDKITAAQEPWSKVHSELPSAAAAKMATIQSYLAKNAPSMRATMSGRGVTMPPESDMQKYAEKLTAAIDPWGVVNRALKSNSKLTGTVLSTLRDVHPEIYAILIESPVDSDVGGMKQLQEMHTMSAQEPSKKIDYSVKPSPSNIQRATMR